MPTTSLAPPPKPPGWPPDQGDLTAPLANAPQGTPPDSTTATSARPTSPPSTVDTTQTAPQPTRGERIRAGILGPLSALGSRDFGQTPLGKKILDYQTSVVNQIKGHQANIDMLRQRLSLAHQGFDQNGQPFASPEEQQSRIQEYTDQLQAEEATFTKLAGVTPEIKKGLGMRQRAIDMFQRLLHQHRASQAKGGATSAQGTPPGSGGATAQPSGAPPPPPGMALAPDVDPSSLAGMGMAGNLGVQQRIATAKAAGIQPGTQEYMEFVSTGKYPSVVTPKVMQRNLAGSAVLKNYPDVRTPTGEKPSSDEQYDILANPDGTLTAAPAGQSQGSTQPRPFNYVGADGKPHRGFTVGMKAFNDKGELFDIPPEVFSAWMAPRTTETVSWKEVQQLDGSIKLVPVTGTSVTTRGAPGGTATAPPSPPKGNGTKPSASSKPPVVPPGRGVTAGGKTPPGVQKAYDTYSAALERYNIMQDALPKAKRGEQQAMLNLLANHVGMTIGLQRGGRITEGLYAEAEKSSPVLARFAAKFDKDGNFSLDPRDYRGGVILTPDQMDQMVDLAEVRLGQDKDFWQREVDAAKQGYGMTGPPPPPTKPKLSRPKPGIVVEQ